MAGVVRNISTRMSIEGDAEYKQKLSGINSEIKTLGSQLKLTESQFAGQANSMAALTAKGSALSNLYQAQQQKVNALAEALKNAQTSQQTYSTRIQEAQSKIAAAEQALSKLKNSTGDTSAAEKKLTDEIDRQKKELQEAQAYYNSATKGVNDWQTKVNDAKVDLNNLDREIQQNKTYLDEAKASTDGAATSIDKYGKETKQAAESSEEATEKGSLLGNIFKGGFFANIASQALTTVISKIKELASAAVETSDELEKMSSETGLTTSQLQEMQYVGDDLGVSVETQSAALKKLINNMESAQAGSGSAYQAFKKLNVAYEDGNKKLLDKNTVYAKIIDALGKMSNETERDALAQDLFGKSATDLNPLIEAGSKVLSDLADEAEHTGAVMSNEAVEGLDAFGDEMDHMKQRMKAFVGETIYSGMQTIEAADDQNEAIDGLFDTIRDGTDATGDFSAKQADAADTINDLSGNLLELQIAYGDAKNAALTSLDSQIGKWAEMDNTAVTSAADVLKALQSQADWISNYEANLDALKERKIPGVDTSELVKSLSDGSAESAEILAGLKKATDSQVAQIVKSMSKVAEGKDSLSGELAEVNSNFDKSMNDLTKKTNETAKSLNVSEITLKSGKQTAQGYIDGLNSKLAEVQAAANRLKGAASGGKSGSVTVTTSGVDGSHASGLSYVPFDGYTAELHRGERVLTAAENSNLSNLNLSAASRVYSETNVNHTGTIRVEGVNSQGELEAVAEFVVEKIARESRLI